MTDVFRLDLSDKDCEFVKDTLDGFCQGASKYGRKLVEIRGRRAMIDRLASQPKEGRPYEDVEIVVADTGFDETLEVVLAPTC
ncbi:hypothetical protein [Methylosinus sporium]|uniref:hypothetical protein n=1 Tax=Methylosinus sporium TaxID=428 RepID=UPI00383A0E9E